MSGEFENNYQSPQYQGFKGNDSKGMAIASMILGIVSIVLCCIWYISLIAGIVGIVLGIMHNRKNEKSGMATAGIICSVIGIILTIAILILAAIGIAAMGGISALDAYR